MNATTAQEAQVLDLEPLNEQAQLPALQQTGTLSINSPAGIMMQALARGLTPADIREMLALQREWRADEAINAFNLALANFKTESIPILKSKKVGYETKDGGFVGYKHAELFDVVAAVGPVLAKHGLSHRWDVVQTPSWITVKCILKHSAGHSEFCEMGGPPDDSGKKNRIQQIASTVSYLQRYTLKAITGVAEGGEDDDGHGGADDPPTGAPGTVGPKTYPEDRFAANLPKWSGVMLSGRLTADQVIAKAEAQFPLTKKQTADIRAVLSLILTRRSSMRILNAKQGSPEWLAHRLTKLNASDAPAMLGCSKYKTRTQLIREVATGLSAEVSAETQQIFDAGHAYEALARPLAEAILGEDLYPVTGYEGALSASFDGLTLDDSTAWEHKSLNDALRAVLPEAMDGVGDDSIGAQLPLMYRVQMEQQAYVSNCARVLFTASKWQGEDLIECRHCWYRADPELRAQLLAGWKQFEADVAAYQPTTTAEAIEVVGHQPEQLPALRSTVRGELVLDSNIKEWETAALAYIKGVREHELKTDEDFANAAAASDWCEASKTSLLGVRASLMGATGDVNTAVATLDRIAAELDKTRIAFDKAIKARKDARKEELVLAAQGKMREHLATLTARVGFPVFAAADFPGATKNLKSFASMEAKLDAELARAKIEASRIADLVQTNTKALAELAPEHDFLFVDKAQILLKQPEDFTALVKVRISEHLAAEEKKRADAIKKLRDEDIQRRITRLCAWPVGLRETEASAAHVAEKIEQIRATEISEADFGDRAAEAETHRVNVLASLQTLHASLVAAEEKAAEPAPAPVAAAPTPASVAAPMVAPAPAPAAVSGGSFRRAETTEQPTLTLGEINARIAPLSIASAGLEQLGYPATKVKAACMYRHSQWPQIHAALVRSLASAQVLEAA